MKEEESAGWVMRVLLKRGWEQRRDFMKLSADNLDKVSPHKRMLFRDEEETFPAMVTHRLPYQADHGSLSFQTFLRQKVEERVTSKMHPLQPNCLKSSGKSHMLSLDCRLPSHSFVQNSFKRGAFRAIPVISLHLSLRLYFQHKFTRRGSAISRWLE